LRGGAPPADAVVVSPWTRESLARALALPVTGD
jgi:hypothetical protein